MKVRLDHHPSYWGKLKSFQPAMVEAPFLLWCAIGSGHGPSPFLAPFDSPPLREQIDTAAPLAPGERDRTATTHGETMVEYTFHI